MPPPITASDVYTVVGLLLSLVGLLATFFSVQLSQWLMSILATESKWKAYSAGNDEEAKSARRECAAEISASYNVVPFGITLAVGTFVWLVISASLSALALIEETKLRAILTNVLWAFVWSYGSLTLLLLIFGYLMGRSLKQKIAKKNA